MIAMSYLFGVINEDISCAIICCLEQCVWENALRGDMKIWKKRIYESLWKNAINYLL